MDINTYSRKVDEIVALIEDGFYVLAFQAYEELLERSSSSKQALESTIKSQMFQHVGPKVDRLWTSFMLAETRAKVA